MKRYDHHYDGDTETVDGDWVRAVDALALIDAQAAVIERVRAWLDEPYRDEGERMFVELREILAAAPEHTVSASKEFELGYAAGWLQGQRDAPTVRLDRDIAVATANLRAELEIQRSAYEDLRAEKTDLHSRVSELEAVLDHESRAKLEAMAAVERLSSAPPQPHVTQLRLRQQLDADQS